MVENEIPAGSDREGNGLLYVRVQPRSSKNRVFGVYDGALKIAVTAPPVEGKANACIITYLAKLFNVPRSSLGIKTGATSRIKTVVFKNVGEEEISRRLIELL